MRETLLLLALGAALLAPAPRPARAETALAPPPGDGWAEFRSEPGRFRVRLPSEPVAESSSRLTLAGRIHSTIYRYRDGDLELSVEHHDVPALAHLFVSSQGLLDRAEAGLVDNEHGTGFESAATALDGHPARQVSYRIRREVEHRVDALLVLVGRRLYIASAQRPPASAWNAGVERFFRSLRLGEP